MNEEKTRDMFLHMAAQDTINLKFRNSEMLASLTPKGEKEALDLIGGKDIADLAWCFTEILVQYGDAFGNKVAEDKSIKTWLEMIQIARALKFYHLPLEGLIEKLNNEFGKREE